MASNIPWQSDGEHEYFIIKDSEFTCEVSKDNAEIYTHSEMHKKLDHIFIRVDDERGFFCWRKLVEKVLGEDSFDAMVDEMIDHDIEDLYLEEPIQGDVEEWERYFKCKYEPDQELFVEDIVTKALFNFDSAWAYYFKEWSNDV